MDRILIQMPVELELFFPAVSVVHDYVLQQARQIAQGTKSYDDLQIVVELGDEEQFFYAPLFPRLHVSLQGLNRLTRTDWDCLVDLRTTVGTALNLATTLQKHLTDAWGIMCGASPRRVPELGLMATKPNPEVLDVVIDNNVEYGSKLQEYLQTNYPLLKVETQKVEGLRASHMFDRLRNTKMYVGKRSAASYLAAAMKKKLVELYMNDLPLWFMGKNPDGNYKVFYGKEFPAEMLWIGCEELLGDKQWIGGETTSRVDQLQV